MRFCNHSDMASALLQHRRKLPSQIDLVVGIPRSGMLPASMIATQMNIPMVDADGFMDGKLFRHGSTKKRPDLDRSMARDRTVLIIDDTVGSGRAIRDLKAEIANRDISGNLVYAAVWSPVAAHPDVDVVLEKIDETICFPWNIMHHAMLGEACADIDGVLCANPKPHESYDPRAYVRFLEDTPLLHRTSRKIGWLVSGRPEKYRAVTEHWLACNNVEYGELIMASPEDTQDLAAYKARVYRKTGAKIFVHGESHNAALVAKLSGRPVVCMNRLEMIYPADVECLERYRQECRADWRQRQSTLKLAFRRMIGSEMYSRLKAVKAPHPN